MQLGQCSILHCFSRELHCSLQRGLHCSCTVDCTVPAPWIALFLHRGLHCSCTVDCTVPCIADCHVPCSMDWYCFCNVDCTVPCSANIPALLFFYIAESLLLLPTCTVYTALIALFIQDCNVIAMFITVHFLYKVDFLHCTEANKPKYLRFRLRKRNDAAACSSSSATLLANMDNTDVLC
jgi:hypothetical protein